MSVDPQQAVSEAFAPSGVERWTLSPSATAFVRERAERLKTDPATILEDLVLVERRRVEGVV